MAEQKLVGYSSFTYIIVVSINLLSSHPEQDSLNQLAGQMKNY